MIFHRYLPPFKRYIVFYFALGTAIIVLGLVAAKLSFDFSDSSKTAPLIFISVCIAIFSIFATNWSQWRTSSVQHTLSALQTLRQDEDYLKYVFVVKRRIGPFGTPILPEQVDEILRRESNASINNPSFSDASLFILNQYEFLAAAARMGAMDFELLEKTTKSNLCDAVRSFQPLILRIRKEYKKEHFENLVWLYHKFEGYDGYILGPEDEVPAWLQRN